MNLALAHLHNRIATTLDMFGLKLILVLILSVSIGIYCELNREKRTLLWEPGASRLQVSKSN